MGFAKSFVKAAIMSLNLTHRGSPHTVLEYLSSSELLHLKEHNGPVLGKSTKISGEKRKSLLHFWCAGYFSTLAPLQAALVLPIFNRAIPCTAQLDWSPWEAKETGVQHSHPFYVCRSLYAFPAEMHSHNMNINHLKTGWHSLAWLLLQIL